MNRGHVSHSPARAAAPPVVFDCTQGQVRPRSFILACADGNNYLTKPQSGPKTWTGTLAS